MSTLKEEENSDNFSNIFEKDIYMHLSQNPLEGQEQPNSFNSEEKNNFSHSSYIFSDKSRPLFINNENFINYFMHIDYNTPLNKENGLTLEDKINSLKEESSSQHNSFNPQNILNSSNENQNKSSILSKNSKKEKEYGILTDSKTGITYNEEEDPVNYRKAKKRIQNRESALRMKKMRENGNNKLEDELNHLREDNIRLINENISLKKEKEFLIEQIKFMQKVIKQSNLEFKLKSENLDSTDNNSSSSNDEIKKEPVFYYDGSKQKIKGKLFNVFIICTLSLIYIIGEYSLNEEKSSNQNTGIGNEHSIQLNSIKEKEGLKNNSVWFYLSKIILVTIFLMIIPLFKGIKNFFDMIINKNKRHKSSEHKYY